MAYLINLMPYKGKSWHDFKVYLSRVYRKGEKKAKKIKTVCNGFQEFLKLSAKANQASLKLSANFSISVCWTFETILRCKRM